VPSGPPATHPAGRHSNESTESLGALRGLLGYGSRTSACGAAETTSRARLLPAFWRGGSFSPSRLVLPSLQGFAARILLGRCAPAGAADHRTPPTRGSVGHLLLILHLRGDGLPVVRVGTGCRCFGNGLQPELSCHHSLPACGHQVGPPCYWHSQTRWEQTCTLGRDCGGRSQQDGIEMVASSSKTHGIRGELTSAP
jgi:hypothetical protein